MPRKGLTEAMIVKAAVEIVEEQGYKNLSLRELAARLDVKPPALYNHISGIEELYASIAGVAADRLNAALAAAVREKPRDEAFIAVCYAYRDFVINANELYKSIIHVPRLGVEDARTISATAIEPLHEILRQFRLRETETVHMLRYIRSTLHGFSWLEGAGFMRINPLPIEDTFGVIVQDLLSALLERERASAGRTVL